MNNETEIISNLKMTNHFFIVSITNKDHKTLMSLFKTREQAEEFVKASHQSKGNKPYLWASIVEVHPDHWLGINTKNEWSHAEVIA